MSLQMSIIWQFDCLFNRLFLLVEASKHQSPPLLALWEGLHHSPVLPIFHFIMIVLHAKLYHTWIIWQRESPDRVFGVNDIIYHGRIPANTQRNKLVIITSKRCFDIIIACLLHFVFARILVWRGSRNQEFHMETTCPYTKVKFTFNNRPVQAGSLIKNYTNMYK